MVMLKALLVFCLLGNTIMGAIHSSMKNWKMVVVAVIGVIACILGLAGCASIEPNAVSIDAEHVSHISQHFGAHPTNFGYDAAVLAARWSRGRFHWRLADGVVLESQDPRVNEKCYGGLWGPREVFEASAGYDIWRK